MSSTPDFSVVPADVALAFIPVTDLAVGDIIAGGQVTAIRASKSGKTVYITVSDRYEFDQRAGTNIAARKPPRN